MDLTDRLKAWMNIVTGRNSLVYVMAAWMNIVTGRNSLVYVMAVLTAEMEDCLLTT
jgi:hypothetical protein